jgi:hypothetical protein
MKKIAICFYGQPRKLEKGYVSLHKSFYEKYTNEQIDTFVHTWYDENLQKYEASTHRFIDENELKIDRQCIEKIKELYSPKRMIVEKPVSFDFSNLIESRIYKNSNAHLLQNLQNTFSQLYSKYQIGKIFEDYCQEHSIQYDIIVCIRFDFVNVIHLDLLNLPSYKIYSCPQPNQRFLLNDNCIVFTHFHLFLFYTKAIENIAMFKNDEIFEIICKYELEGFELSPETISTANLIFCLGNKIHHILEFHPDIPNFF